MKLFDIREHVKKQGKTRKVNFSLEQAMKAQGG
jgi:hypothetical protein